MIKKLRPVWEEADKNHDNSLNEDEFKAFMPLALKAITGKPVTPDDLPESDKEW